MQSFINLNFIEKFIEYISLEKNYSSHTVLAYKNDLNSFSNFCLTDFNQKKNEDSAPNQDNKIDNNFEKKKIAVNQLKSSSQEKQNKILDEQKSINNLEIKSFKELIDMCNLKKELELKYELETNVNLINFKNGYIEISFNENLKKDFVKILSSKLYEWTNTRWIISLSQNKGQETIKKTSEGEKKNNLKDFEQTDIFNNIKNSFPDAELIDIKDNKDD